MKNEPSHGKTIDRQGDDYYTHELIVRNKQHWRAPSDQPCLKSELSEAN